MNAGVHSAVTLNDREAQPKSWKNDCGETRLTVHPPDFVSKGGVDKEMRHLGKQKMYISVDQLTVTLASVSTNTCMSIGLERRR
jgi:hypothetical protein